MEELRAEFLKLMGIVAELKGEIEDLKEQLAALTSVDTNPWNPFQPYYTMPKTGTYTVASGSSTAGTIVAKVSHANDPCPNGGDHEYPVIINPYSVEVCVKCGASEGASTSSASVPMGTTYKGSGAI